MVPRPPVRFDGARPRVASGPALELVRDRPPGLDLDEARTTVTPRPQAHAPAPPPPPPVTLPAAALPPALAAQVYALVKRLAMQHGVIEADRVLRAGLAELTGSPIVFVVLHDGQAPFVAEGGFPPPELVPPAAVAAIAREHRPMVAPRLAMIPILGGAAAIGVIVIARRSDQPPYAPTDVAVAGAAAHECAGLVNGLLASRRRFDDAAADLPFRREAFDASRQRGHAGPAFQVAPGWVRWAYPIVLGLVVTALAAAALIDVPTYATGSAIVMIDGHRVTARTSGVVEEVFVSAGQEVAAGAALARLHDTDEAADLDEVTTEYEGALIALLFEPTDRTARATAIALAPRAKRAMDRVGARILRAPSAGRVRDVRIRAGSPIAAGEHVLTVVDDDAAPEVIALMPARDLPRLHEGMPMLVRLEGYGKSREVATIVEVGREGIGPMAARRSLGEELADALPIAGPVVVVRATMPHRDFDTGEDRRLELHNGMTAIGEVEIAEQSFLRTIVPGLGGH